ncbi:MAG: glycosyltransferase family 2 protein [Calditrichaeota bacterium]|nr:MAG: glycosyltransferase family 2 protein [Calditrichota bacterium]
MYVFSKMKSKNQIMYDSQYCPEVSIIISAYNEEDVIEKKILNSLSLDYPREKLEILVVSDGSTDKTDEIVTKIATKEKQVRLLRLSGRSGKTLGLNQGVHHAKGKIVVFSDANAIYDRNAIKELVKYFVDERVGFVVGHAIYHDEDNPAAQNEGLYWKYETLLKELESRFHSVCVGDGAIFAIRKELYENLEPDDIGDFATPLIIAAKGYLGIFNPQAKCFEKAAGDFQKEFYRKRRIVNRSFRAFRKYVGRFDWISQFNFIFELFSHKILRWFNWLLILTLIISNVLLVVLSPSPFYNTLLILQAILGLATFMGGFAILKGQELPSYLSLPFYFSSSHLAALLGIIDDLRGEKYVTWSHVRETNHSGEEL